MSPFVFIIIPLQLSSMVNSSSIFCIIYVYLQAVLRSFIERLPGCDRTPVLKSFREPVFVCNEYKIGFRPSSAALVTVFVFSLHFYIFVSCTAHSALLSPFFNHTSFVFCFFSNTFFRHIFLFAFLLSRSLFSSPNMHALFLSLNLNPNPTFKNLVQTYYIF